VKEMSFKSGVKGRGSDIGDESEAVASERNQYCVGELSSKPKG